LANRLIAAIGTLDEKETPQLEEPQHYTSRKNLTLGFSYAKIFPSPYQKERCPEPTG
jgi:hypothetical protein